MGAGPSKFDYPSLKEALKETYAEVLLPGDGAKYNKSILRWSEHCVKQAAAVVLPTSADDISATLAIIRKHKVPFTVKGGGHSTFGSASIEDGIVIDLSKMRKVTVDLTAKTIKAEGGANWEDVDLEAAKYGLATVGGTVNHTGVGGLTLGGGYGYLTGKYGLAIDVLKSVEVVLASGEQVTASENQNPDLFWAIRGAGTNFGVVTSFTFQGFEQKSHVFAGFLVFLPDKLPQVVKFVNKFHEITDGNQAILWGFTAPPPAHAPVVLAQLFHNGTEDDGRVFFADLFELDPLMNSTSSMPYEKVNSLFNPMVSYDGRKQHGGGAFRLPLNPTFVQDLYNEFNAFVSSHKRLEESMLVFECIPYDKILEVPNDATSFCNRGDYYNVVTVFKWFDESLDQEIRNFSRGLMRKTSETAAERSNDGGVGQYGNYTQVDVEANEVFGENVKRLEDLKSRYDPDNLFSHGTRLTPRPLVVVN